MEAIGNPRNNCADKVGNEVHNLLGQNHRQVPNSTNRKRSKSPKKSTSQAIIVQESDSNNLNLKLLASNQSANKVELTNCSQNTHTVDETT